MYLERMRMMRATLDSGVVMVIEIGKAMCRVNAEGEG